MTNTQPTLGTIAYSNFCEYMIDISKTPAKKNIWRRKQEESEYQAYLKAA